MARATPNATVKPLEESWRVVVDDVLGSLGAPRTEDVSRLGPKVAELSRAYNAGEAGVGKAVPLDARVAFSFARDVPKGAAAVRELVATRALRLHGSGGPALRLLDVGAGIGAMTWGIARALAAAGEQGRIEATLVDADARALAAAKKIADAASRHRDETLEGVELTVTTAERTVRAGTRGAWPSGFDLVVAGQVLSELDAELGPDARAAAHAELLLDLLNGSVKDDGALVVVEPALKGRTRHLHAVREIVLARGATVFAPCLHARACPALANEDDWCHEDLAVDLPGWLVPLARASGLRWQGLTFSYLVLRRDGLRLVDSIAPSPSRFRVVSDLLRTKGKTEVFGCTDEGRRVRLRRLERDERRSPTGWDELARGDVVRVEGEVDETGRLAPDVTVDVDALRDPRPVRT